jgi:hypothetical protein
VRCGGCDEFDVFLQWGGLAMNTEFWWGNLSEKDKLEKKEKGV